MNTTLDLIRAQSPKPCTNGWKKLLKYLGKTTSDSEPLSLLTILESNGLDDALWCLRATPDSDSKARLFAVFCARQVQPLSPDPRAVKVIDTAEAFALGKATREELEAASIAASYAARSAASEAASYAARYAASYAARYAASEAASEAARYAARYAARSAAYYAAYAAYAATDAAFDATQQAQITYFKELFQ